MTTGVLSGEELAKLGFPYQERELFFLIDYPQFKNKVPFLLGPYRTCQARKLQGRPVEVDEAYNHIFIEGCEWCQEQFKSLEKSLDEILAQNNKD